MRPSLSNSTRTIDIDQFVPREEIDDLYNIRPYFIAPEGKVGADAFVTIREAIAATGKVALGRLVLTTREHMIALEPRGKGLMGTLLRYPYEVRDEADYFEDIPNIKIEKEMLDLAKHIVQTKAGHFEPDKFEDRYETALREVINKKAKGEKIEVTKPERPSNVINLMDALKQSLAAERGEKAPASAHGHGKASKAARRKSAHPLKLQRRLGKPARAGWRSRQPALNQTKLRSEPNNGSWLQPFALAQHAHGGPDLDHHQVRGGAILC